MSQLSPPLPPQPGCSRGVMVLCLCTLLVFCCVIPQAIWLPFGVYYEVNRLAVGAEADVAARVVEDRLWLVLAPPLLLNACWMAYAIWQWRRLGGEPLAANRLSSLPEDASKPFLPTPEPKDGPAPHVQTDTTGVLPPQG